MNQPDRPMGQQAYTLDDVAIGHVRESERRADGSIWVTVISPQLAAEGRQLRVPLGETQWGEGWARVPFTDRELHCALYGETDAVISTQVEFPRTHVNGAAVDPGDGAVVVERRQKPRGPRPLFDALGASG